MSEFAASPPGQAPGLEVWRIEDMTAVPLTKSEYGKFNQGDAYIVLKTTQPKTKLVWDLFFWLGVESTADEQGVAAFKTVEIDDALGGAPVQHREEQGKESQEFLQCFKSIEYRPGKPVRTAAGRSCGVRTRRAVAQGVRDRHLHQLSRPACSRDRRQGLGLQAC
jgi:hypothetical protein